MGKINGFFVFLLPTFEMIYSSCKTLPPVDICEYCTVEKGASLEHLGSFGHFWALLGSFWLIWAHLGSFGLLRTLALR